VHRPIRRAISLVATFCVLLGGTAWGQTVDSSEVETLSTADVGPFRPETSPDLDEVRQMIVERTNEFRESKDRESVTTDDTLHETAKSFAEYMAKHDRYGHRADDRTPSERARAQEYDFCLVSENIAYQFSTTGFTTSELAKRFVEGWIDSPGHRRNMLRKEVVETGVGLARSEWTGIVYAVQMFGRPKSQAITFTLLNESAEAIAYTVGDREYDLPERYRRQHQLCGPSSLKLAGESADTIEVEDGARYRVVAAGENLEIEWAE
jgi:uncharacterized protein YkwD